MNHQVLLAFVGALSGGTLFAEGSLHRERYLLLDSRVIEKTENVRLAVGTVRKHAANPLFGQEFPWEPHFANFYGNVHYDAVLQDYVTDFGLQQRVGRR